MPRSFNAILACVFLVSFLAIGFGAAPVQATSYLFTATTVDRYADMYGDFTLIYADSSFSPRFSIDELVAGTFSGTTFTMGDMRPPGFAYETIDRVPGYDPVRAPYTDGTGTEYNGLEWRFSHDWGGGVVEIGPGLPPDLWTYTQVEVVPLPPSVFLLGAGLIGLAGWRRFRKS